MSGSLLTSEEQSFWDNMIFIIHFLHCSNVHLTQKKHHHKWLPVPNSWVHLAKRLKIKFIINIHSHMGSQDWDKELSFPYHLCQNHSSGCQVKGCPRVWHLCWDYCNLFCKHGVPVLSPINLALFKGFKSYLN